MNPDVHWERKKEKKIQELTNPEFISLPPLTKRENIKRFKLTTFCLVDYSSFTALWSTRV